ncbi:MAG: type 2 isopentenyl-diphosphate Delta-isomerase [Thaumarchaeota archaeon]|nr:type 2 isopentenyl-diphosphate Delta-isomerase [Nitrososphaerota archaeon]
MNEIRKRKEEDIELILKEGVQSRATTLLECVKLIHNALPELSFDEIDLSTEFLGHKFSFPILIDSMVGGSPKAKELNRNLALAAEELGIGMGVGSQRAALEDEGLAESYKVVREVAPNAFVMANIGAAQLKSMKKRELKKLIDMVKADALAIHLNPLQELIQPEGETDFRGVLEKIDEISDLVPVIVKEVGAGISREVAIKLELAGVSAINVAGLGGTSWAGVESLRARGIDERKEMLGELLWDWGIPTAASLIEVRNAVKIPVIASGGLRNGLEVAKCIALGADMTGMADPLLKAASKSKEEVVKFLKDRALELKAVMFLVGAKNVEELKGARYVITGELAEWL